ncbi:MAG TPA: hypothetical protein VFJ58_16095 [Armatimonadota bacterium]|nr:hypothetical protein [Armatimonadota bacterium]
MLERNPGICLLLALALPAAGSILTPGGAWAETCKAAALAPEAVRMPETSRSR